MGQVHACCKYKIHCVVNSYAGMTQSMKSGKTNIFQFKGIGKGLCKNSWRAPCNVYVSGLEKSPVR